MMRPAPAPSRVHGLNLHRRSRTPPWLTLVWRALLAAALISVVLAAHWLDRDGLKDSADGVVSFLDLLYFTAVTVTTVGYGDIVPVSDEARMLDTFVVTPIRVFLWLIFLGTAYDFVFRQVWERWRMSAIQRRLQDHIIIAGYGASGAESVRELLRRGADAREIVVIDQKPEALEAAAASGVNILEADATRDGLGGGAGRARPRSHRLRRA